MPGLRSFVRRVAATALLFAVWSPGVPVRAQSDTGEITIAVVDSAAGAPVANARAILVGPQTASALTTAAGVIRYTDVPVGIYRVRVVRSGYASGASDEFDVLAGRAVQVRVALALAGGLRTIGSVTARGSVTVSSSDVGDDGPLRRLSDSLTDALDKVAGVTVTQDATDPNSAVTVSLNGHDESQTAVSLDGIPLAAPGGTANLRAIGTDLFSGASSSTSPSAGALGGGITFRTLQPTQAVQVRANGTTGTFDRSNYQLAATGSVGSLGLAVEHTWRGANSPLTFQAYRDQSGLTYPHEGESTTLGDFVKFRYRLRDERTTLSGTALSNDVDANAICARDVTLLPCGIGPGNRNYGRFGFAYATVASLIGTVATSLSIYANANVQHTDDANRYALLPLDPSGAPCDDATAGLGAFGYAEQRCPSTGTTTTNTRGVAYSASIALGRHTFALTGNTYASVGTNVPVAGSRFETAFTNAVDATTYQLADSFKSSDELTLAPRVSVVTTTSLGTSLLGGFGATWRPRQADTFNASLGIGSAQPSLNVNRSFADPVSARFDCSAGTALVGGPGDTGGGRQSAVSFDTAWTHAFVRSGAQVSVDLYSQVQTGQLINAAIAEPSTYFPAGYLAAIDAAYRAQTVCGATAAAPAVYVNEPVGGTRRLYRGLTAGGRFGIGRYFVALPTYTLNVARLTAASGRLSDGPSTTIAGAQLPGRPIHRAGITLDGLLPRSGLELLANVQYTGGNNQQNLGPYTLIAAGISHALGPGRVSLFENNLFGTYAGDFATDAFAQPLPLSGGSGVLRTAATPLTPRVLSLSYSLAFGGARPGPALASLPVAGRGGAPAAQANAPGVDRARLVPLPPPPGIDPLALATSRPSCDAQVAPGAAAFLTALRAYVAAYEAKAALPSVPNVEIVPHVVTADASVPYYLDVRPRAPDGAPAPGGVPDAPSPRLAHAEGEGGGPSVPGGVTGGPGSVAGGPGGVGVGGGPVGPGGSGGSVAGGERAASGAPRGGIGRFRALAGCAYLTVYTASEAKAKGIVTQNGRPALIYVPGVGLVFVRAPQLPQGGGSLKSGA